MESELLTNQNNTKDSKLTPEIKESEKNESSIDEDPELLEDQSFFEE